MALTRVQLDDIIDLANSVVKSAGFECIEAEWASDQRVLRLYMDRTGGIDIDGCVAASRLLNQLSELDKLIPGQYTLEVSSPGVERPLRQQEHFQRHIGELIQVKLSEKVLDRRCGKGRLLAVSNGSHLKESTMSVEDPVMVTLETPQGQWSFPLRAVQRASLVYDWSDK